jgi:hypothetical protein
VAFVRAAHENRLKSENLTEDIEAEKSDFFDVREMVIAVGDER